MAAEINGKPVYCGGMIGAVGIDVTRECHMFNGAEWERIADMGTPRRLSGEGEA